MAIFIIKKNQLFLCYLIDNAEDKQNHCHLGLIIGQRCSAKSVGC